MPAGIFWLRLRLAYGLPAALGVAQEQAAFECRKRLSRRIEADWPRNQHARFAFAVAVCGLRFLWHHTSSHPSIDRPTQSLSRCRLCLLRDGFLLCYAGAVASISFDDNGRSGPHSPPVATAPPSRM